MENKTFKNDYEKLKYLVNEKIKLEKDKKNSSIYSEKIDNFLSSKSLVELEFMNTYLKQEYDNLIYLSKGEIASEGTKNYVKEKLKTNEICSELMSRFYELKQKNKFAKKVLK